MPTFIALPCTHKLTLSYSVVHKVLAHLAQFWAEVLAECKERPTDHVLTDTHHAMLIWGAALQAIHNLVKNWVEMCTIMARLS
jgi:hypothetical protein